MPTHTFQSSHLNRVVGYDTESRRLLLEFTNGAVYAYDQVPFTEYHNLLQSDSPGGYFHAKIKGLYPTVKLAEGHSRKRQR